MSKKEELKVPGIIDIDIPDHKMELQTVNF